MTELEEAQQRLLNKRKSIPPRPEPATAAQSIPEIKSFTKEREEELKADEKENRIRLVHSMLESSNIPLRHKKRTDLDRSGQWAKTEDGLRQRLGSGFLIALTGLRGNGKTQLGVELIRSSCKALKPSRFCSATEFFMAIKAGYTNQKSEEDIVKSFQRPRLLVIDEIGVRSESDWENRLLFELLNRRYNSLTDTLLITNQEASKLRDSIGPSLASRCVETGGVINCDWPTFRR